MIGIVGIVAMIAIAVLCSENRRAIQFKHAFRTLALMIGIAVLALATPIGLSMLSGVSSGVQQMIGHVNEGTRFVFGPLADQSGGVIIAFQVLPVIIFIGALVALLFHLRIMTWIIHWLGGAVRFLTGASRLESTCAAANVFVGMAEAPLTILPFLPKISRAQLFTLMALGLSSVAGSVLVAYASLGMRVDLLVTAAFMAAPGGLLIARILIPETETAYDVDSLKTLNESADADRAGSLVEAVTNGATIGLKVMLNVIAVLIAFIALIALLNAILGGVGGWLGFPELSMEMILGWLFAPVAFVIGVPWVESLQAGAYLGEKVILNEFLAYLHFSPDIENFSEAGQIAITVALCGFANLSGLAILIAGLSSVVPERSSEIAKLGLKTVLAGTLANFLSASIVSVVMALT
ncbi:MAG: NupC/NupG family nucleoside CNT transporter [Woeseiaceae bacterium]